jgi:hypothetical protein
VIIALAKSPAEDTGDLRVVEEVAHSGIALGLLSVNGWAGQLLDEIERVYWASNGIHIQRRDIWLPGSSPPALPGRIYVRFCGAHEAMDAEPEWTVGDLKLMLHERTTIAPRYQQLVVGDRLLDDDETALEDCGVGRGSTVKLFVSQWEDQPERGDDLEDHIISMTASACKVAIARLAERKPKGTGRRRGPRPG